MYRCIWSLFHSFVCVEEELYQLEPLLFPVRASAEKTLEEQFRRIKPTCSILMVAPVRNSFDPQRLSLTCHASSVTHSQCFISHDGTVYRIYFVVSASRQSRGMQSWRRTTDQHNLLFRKLSILISLLGFIRNIPRGQGFPRGYRAIGRTSLRASQSAARNLRMTTPLNVEKSKLSFVEIGANLLDERFTEGIYYGKQRHEPDMASVLERAQAAGVTHMILTAGTLRESRRALEMVRDLRQRHAEEKSIVFGCTVGVHPTRCAQEFVDREDGKSPQEVLESLKELAIDGQSDQSVVCIGEIGLDYDRLEFCSKEIQQDYLHKQIEAMSCPELERLPFFLHNRNVNTDLLDILQNLDKPVRGVVHSFDDSLELATKFIKLGLYIGLNGCSLKTQENLEVVKKLPIDRILLETDCPYCEIKPTHAGFKFIERKWGKKAEKKFELGKMVKARNEPCQIVQVAEVIAGVKGIPVEEVASTCFHNSLKFYGWKAE